MIIKGQLNSTLAKQIVSVVGEVSAQQLTDAIEVLHDDGSELSDDEQIRLRGVMASQGLPVTEAQQKAAAARALIAVRKAQVAEAQAAWEAAFRAVNPDGALPGDPEVEWQDPDSEEEAAQDLAVAYLGGQLVAARGAFESAQGAAQRTTQAAMCEAALLGRKAWRERHL
jgi:hypothetical protein